MSDPSPQPLAPAHQVAWRISREHGPRAASVAAAIRHCQSKALRLADEAERECQPLIARSLKRKALRTRPTDIHITHWSDRVRVSLSAYDDSVVAIRHSTQPPP